MRTHTCTHASQHTKHVCVGSNANAHTHVCVRVLSTSAHMWLLAKHVAVAAYIYSPTSHRAIVGRTRANTHAHSRLHPPAPFCSWQTCVWIYLIIHFHPLSLLNILQSTPRMPYSCSLCDGCVRQIGPVPPAHRASFIPETPPPVENFDDPNPVRSRTPETHTRAEHVHVRACACVCMCVRAQCCANPFSSCRRNVLSVGRTDGVVVD